MLVKAYNTGRYQNTSVYAVQRIEAMPDADEITEEDKEYADGIMLHLVTDDGRDIFLPPALLISIT